MDPSSRLFRLSLLYGSIFGAFAVVFPFLPIYMDMRGLPPSRIGILLGIVEAAGVAAPLLISRVADRTGRYRLLMTLAGLAAGLSFLLFHRWEPFWALAAAAAAFGLFYKPIAPLADALSGRALADSSRNYGRVRAWGTVSFIVVSLALQSTGLLEGASVRRLSTAILIALMLPVAVMPAAPEVRRSSPSDSPRDEPAGRPKGFPGAYTTFLAVGFLGNIGFGVFRSFGSLYFNDLVGTRAVSGMYTLAALSEIPVLVFGGLFLKRLGHRRMLTVSLAAMAVRSLVLAGLPHVLPAALSQLTHAFTFGFYLIVGVDWVNRVVPEGRRALGMGLFMALSHGAAQLVGSVLGGFLLEAGGFGLMFGTATVFPLAAMAVLAVRRDIAGVAHLDAR